MNRQEKSAIKKGLKALLRQNGFKNVKVWNIETEVDYKDQIWINIESSANTKKQ